MPNPFMIEVDDRDLKKLLNTLKEKAGNLLPAMMAIGNVVANSVRRNFDEGGRPEKWEKLSDATVLGSLSSKDYDKRRTTKTLNSSAKKRLGSKKVLIGLGMRGGLMGSIHSDANSDSVVIGPDERPYARIHQFGGEAGRKSNRVQIPARPYLIMQDEDTETAKDIILDHLMSR